MFIKIVHLQLFNVKCRFIHLQQFDVKFLFFEKYIFRKQTKTAAYRRVPLFRILNSLRKMMTCYLWGADKFLRHCILCMSILKCVFPIKGIGLTRFVLFEVLRVPQLCITLVQTISVGHVQKSIENKRSSKEIKFSVPD